MLKIDLSLIGLLRYLKNDIEKLEKSMNKQSNYYRKIENKQP